jgi:cytidylate kinase
VTPRVIAIDGPAASGKSTTAAAVARELGALHLDSGALYRGLTAVALELPRRDAAVIVGAAEARGLSLRQAGEEVIPHLDGRPAEDRIRGPEVTRLVSEVSALAEVRAWVNARLREAVSQGTLVVMDGRDIGTAVFPDAPVKVFLTATPEARARRRLLQRGERPSPAEIAAEASALAERDRKDSAREVAPLRQAADAMLLDTTNLSFEEQVGEIVRLSRTRLP